MKRKSRGFLPIVVFFAVLNAFFITGKDMLARWGADRDVLILGNCLIFIITLASFMIAFKGLNHTNPNVFMRSVMASIMTPSPETMLTIGFLNNARSCK